MGFICAGFFAGFVDRCVGAAAGSDCVCVVVFWEFSDFFDAERWERLVDGFFSIFGDSAFGGLGSIFGEDFGIGFALRDFFDGYDCIFFGVYWFSCLVCYFAVGGGIVWIGCCGFGRWCRRLCWV